MLFLIFVGLWILNALIFTKMRSIFADWISMQKWLIEQHKTLSENPDFAEEALQAITLAAQINRWTSQSIKVGTSVILLAQLSLLVEIQLMLLFFGDTYILEAAVVIQSTAFVYAWIIFQRYQKTRGMCYAVNTNVIAMHIYNEHLESNNANELGPPDN